MASSKKKKSPKKPAAKNKAAPKAKTKVKAKAKPAAKKKAAPKKKPAAAKPSSKKKKTTTTPPTPPTKAKARPTHGEAWANASLAPKVKPMATSLEPSGMPTLALHDHEGGLISRVDEQEQLAERIHGGEEAVKNEDADDDTGSPRLDDREDGDE